MGPNTSVQTLGSFLNDVYQYSLKIVGLFVFLMFLYAGFQLMFGNRAKAKTIITDGIVGAILLFSAYVILNSISPDLVGQSSTRTIPPVVRPAQ